MRKAFRDLFAVDLDASEAQKLARALGNDTRAAYYAAEALRWQDVLTSKLWDSGLGFFVNEAQPPPPNLHSQIRAYQRAGKGREVQTYFGCLACHRPREAAAADG